MITLLLIIIFFPLTIPLAIIGFLFGILLELIRGKKEYDKSPYRLVTNKSYFTTVFNKGDIAEYFTWKILNNQSEYKKILINLYIPNGNRTSEIDSILINKHGIFVIESKGYSGWIFGNEKNKYWTQIIYSKKTPFYNPVMQNRSHIKALANILKINNMDIFKSYIVFSERCELKKIKVNKPNVKIIKRHQLQDTLNNDYKIYDNILNKDQINDIYDTLVKYMFPDDNIRNKHIKYIESLKS